MSESLKILILGDSSVGKTSIRNQFISNQFTPTFPTIGANYANKKIKVESQNRQVELHLWDTAGQERFRSLGVSFYRNTDACILVYDVSNKNSTKGLENWISEFVKHAEITDLKTFPFILVGNKTDLCDHRQVSKEEGVELSKTLRQFVLSLIPQDCNDAESGYTVFDKEDPVINRAPRLTSTRTQSAIEMPSFVSVYTTASENTEEDQLKDEIISFIEYPDNSELTTMFESVELGHALSFLKSRATSSVASLEDQEYLLKFPFFETSAKAGSRVGDVFTFLASVVRPIKIRNENNLSSSFRLTDPLHKPTRKKASCDC